VWAGRAQIEEGLLATRTPRRTIEARENGLSAPRICRETGCTTVLSQYNATAWCGLHSRRDWRANREPRRRSESATVPDDDTADEW
jgi:hypothetical protein